MNKTLLKIFAIIPLMFTFGVWRTEGAVTVELNPPRSGLPEGMPFFQAVPLPEGLLSMDPGQMLYSTDSGTPMKARPATYWPDGSVQWLQVSGITGKTAAEKWVNTLDFDVEFPSSEFDSVSVREVVLDGDKIRLLDGNEVFEIAPLLGTHGGADVLMIEDFINHLCGERSIGATSWDARMAVATGYLGTESLRNGSTPFDVPASPLA